MSVTLHRWGNSVGLRVPKPLLEQLGLKAGSEVELKVEDGRLVIEPHCPKRLTLKDVLKGFTPENQPGEVDWGPPVGKEVW
jgi:antitoxin MazE